MTIRVTPRQLMAYYHFISVGFTENGAGAPVGNFCQESGENLDSTMYRAHPDASGGVPEALKSGGIAEWLGGRKTAYIAFADRAETRLGLAKGSLLDDLGTQCDFVVYELRTEPAYATLYQQLTSGTRSIANLTANFMMVYERPKLGPTAGLDNRIAHAEAVVARARELKGAPAPQPSQQSPVPHIPAPQVPSHPPAAFAPTAGPPSVSSATAGLDAAILDHFGAILDALTRQRDAINVRIEKIQAQAEDFAKLEGAEIALPQLLQKLIAKPAAIPQPQRIETVLGTNWKTTLGGIAAILTAAGAGVHAFSVGDMPTALSSISGIVAGIGLIAAKDSNVTGGTVKQ